MSSPWYLLLVLGFAGVVGWVTVWGVVVACFVFGVVVERNQLSDVVAVAGMPGLEVLGEVVRECLPRGRGSAVDPVSLLIFLAGRWAFGSANSFDSLLRYEPVVWGLVRDSAKRVGRVLPGRPPSFDQLRHFRDVADVDVAQRLAEVFSVVGVDVARLVGLLDPDAVSLWHNPAPGGVIYGDGSVFSAWSGVSVDVNGEIRGSRARYQARVSPGFLGKEGVAGRSGLPVSLVGCHGRRRWQRVVLGVDLFRDGNEIGSSMGLFRRVIGLADGGVSHVVYDRLMSGVHMRSLMRLGVLPVVAMPEADERQSHVVLPVGLRRSGFKSAGVREKRKGKGARRRSGDGVAPKARLRLHSFDVVSHWVGSRECFHELWALDGAVVSVCPGESVTVDSLYVDCVSLRWVEEVDGWHPIGIFRVPCRFGDVLVDVDFGGDRVKRRPSGEPYALADWVRPLNESSPFGYVVEGLRSDSESVFATLKALLPYRRAASLDPNHFLLDVVGAGLLINAIAWDMHAGFHSGCGQRAYDKKQKQLLCAPV